MATMNTLGLTDTVSSDVLNERRRTIETVTFDGTDLEIGNNGGYSFPNSDNLRARVLLHLALGQPDTVIPAYDLNCNGSRMQATTIRGSHGFYSGIFMPTIGYNPLTLIEAPPASPHGKPLLTGVMFDTRLIFDEVSGKKIPTTPNPETRQVTQLEARNAAWVRAMGESDGVLSTLDFRKTDPVVTGLLSILHRYTNQELTVDFIQREFMELAGLESIPQEEFVEYMQRMVAAYRRVSVLKNRIFFRTVTQEGQRIGMFSWRTHYGTD